MVWKLLGLQRLLDQLFDEGWHAFGLFGMEGFSCDECVVTPED
ncbi:hypothetical protein [Hydrogenophaga taeniospiralis]|jgi:hypothetical protein|nr:hypothetical protein [Hydrogenophaga taeniospiralis]